MRKSKNPSVDKEQYKHYLIDEIELLKKANDELTKANDALTLTIKKLLEVYEAEDCYTCVCGKVTKCNCKHLGYVKQKLLGAIDIEKLNSMWITKE